MYFLIIATQCIVLITTAASLILIGGLGVRQLARDAFSICGHASAARVPALTDLAVDIFSQHTLCLFDVKAGLFQLKNQNIHVGCKSVLTTNTVIHVELEGDGREYMRAHLEGGIFLHNLDRGRTIQLVTKTGHVS